MDNADKKLPRIVVIPTILGMLLILSVIGFYAWHGSLSDKKPITPEPIYTVPPRIVRPTASEIKVFQGMFATTLEKHEARVLYEFTYPESLFSVRIAADNEAAVTLQETATGKNHSIFFM